MRTRTDSLSLRHLGMRRRKEAHTNSVIKINESKTPDADIQKQAQAYVESIIARKDAEINQDLPPEVEPTKREEIALHTVDLNIWHTAVELIQDKNYWQTQDSPRILVSMRKILDNHEPNEIQFKQLQELVRQKTKAKPGFFHRANIMEQCLYKMFEVTSILDLETNESYLKLQANRRAYQEAEIKNILKPSKKPSKLEEPIDDAEIAELKSTPTKLLPFSREYGSIKSEVPKIVESIESPDLFRKPCR